MRLYRVLSQDEAGSIVERIRELGWAQGRASTPIATGTVKKNLELRAQDGERPLEILKDLHGRLAAHPLHEDNFVSEMLVPKFNRYGVGDAYRSHADAGFMGKRLRTDLACTLFLNDDYEGGELCANGFEVKGEPGVAVVYECWRPHEVRPVTRGERICAITWMQSYIRDSSQREVLGYMRSVMAGINRQTDEERHWAPLTAVYGKLIRMWME